MKEGLNLLPSMAKFQMAKIKLKKNINIIMVVFLSFWVLSVVIIFGWLGVNNYRLKQAENKNTKALNSFKSLATSVVLSKKNKYQAKLVGQVLKERFEYGSLIEKIMDFFPENISLENFKIKNKKQFVLECVLTTGSDMNDVEDKVRDINRGLYPDFSSANLTSIKIGSNSWLFEMEVNLI